MSLSNKKKAKDIKKNKNILKIVNKFIQYIENVDNGVKCNDGDDNK